MKKISLIAITLLLSATMFAQSEKVLFHHSGNVIYTNSISNVDSLTFPNNTVLINDNSSEDNAFPISAIDSITFSTDSTMASSNTVYITFDSSNCTIINPFTDSVLVSDSSNVVSVVSSSSLEDIEYFISGNSSQGSVSISSAQPVKVTLGGINLTNPKGAAITIASNVKTKLNLAIGTTNYLYDGDSSSAKAPLHCAGKLTIMGSGALTLQGYAKHGLSCSKAITMTAGNVTIAGAASDGVHSEGFTMNGGSLKVNATDGDGIDAGSSAITINDGTINVISTADDVKGIKTDDSVFVNGGTIVVSVAGAQSKGIKGAEKVAFTGGATTVTSSGAMVREALGSGWDAKYCTGISSDYNIYITGGTITAINTSTNNGGRCISADSSVYVYGGTLNLTTNGNGDTITNEEGTLDSYGSACIKADYGIYLIAGTITATSNGKAGKGISADSILVIGAQGQADSLLNLTVTTTGAKFYVSGSGENADYANPKVVKCDGNVYLYSGTLILTGQQDGGEGLESKDTLFICGGLTQINTVDDAINAANHISISGGKTYAHASGNDGIDSNGSLEISGGFTIASGASAPEGGFDCDQNTFKITGGILIGTGGDGSAPTTSVTTQHVVKYSGATPGSAICIINSANDTLFTYTLPTYTTTQTGGGTTTGRRWQPWWWRFKFNGNVLLFTFTVNRHLYIELWRRNKWW